MPDRTHHGAAEPRPEADDARGATLPPGLLVDLGGYQLHVLGEGTGSPAVVLSVGAGGVAAEWGLVQPQVAAFARAYAYDRPGSGWSDPGPVPRTMHQEAYEVAEALDRLGERGRVVFVGHSLGGLVGRILSRLRPDVVAGMVLVDSPHESTRLSVQGVLCRLRERATGIPVPPPRAFVESPPASRAEEASPAPKPAIRAPYDRLTEDQQRAWLAARRHERPYDAGGDYLAEELHMLHEAREANPTPLGDRPLVVLAGTRPSPAPPGVQEALWRELYEEKVAQKEDLARLSRNSRFEGDPTSGHHIHLDNPTLVVRAIQEVVEAVRSGARLAQ